MFIGLCMYLAGNISTIYVVREINEDTVVVDAYMSRNDSYLTTQRILKESIYAQGYDEAPCNGLDRRNAGSDQ